MGRQTRWWSAGLSLLAVLAVGGCAAQQDDADGAATPAAGASAPQESGAAGAPEATGTLPGMPTAQRARQLLTTLKVGPHGSMSGYSRSKFPHWAEQGEDCNTRETVLARDGKDVEKDAECRAVSGTWVSVYDDKTFTDASGLDIDHTVPLANAWRSGASKWTQEERRTFANDLTHPQLLSVSAASNRSKGDQGPDEWQPPAKSYWCAYARSWTAVKATYALTVTEAEKNTLTEMLDTCS
ncbi:MULTISPECIES: HNH endonuclease family protein [Streptomyces]|uniref:HNH endonuclease n=1 Tax=Streptomyces xanthii TaxID=2768069 RepID=A0A7H1B285_9ACTN|nr:HNH endonuclease [Streptomyces xanthii]